MEKQREMPWLGEVGKLEPAPLELVTACRNELQAIQLCIQLSGLTYETVCDRLGIDKGHWTRIMSGQAHFPTRRRTALMALCGNYAPIQFELQALSLPQVQESDEQKEIRELESRLNELRGKAVAA